jgi:hypothetical protein
MAPTTYYVSDLSGSDLYIGSTDFPFKTIQTAANIAKPGDTILVHPGIYRERVSPPMGGSSPTLPIIYRSLIPQGAVIRGSVPWNPTRSYSLRKSIVYFSPLLDTYFTDMSAIDGANPFKIPVSVTPYGRNGAPEAANKDANSDVNMIYTLGQVFVNDIMYVQCPYRSEMETIINSWYYDLSTNQLYVNIPNDIINPSIEITNQRRLFAPHIRGLRNIIIDGFIFERCGNNYPNRFWTVPQNQQAGAVGTRCGKFWTIQNNIIRYANGIGIDWGNEGGPDQDLETPFVSGTTTNGKAVASSGHTIQKNIISDNGAAGTASFLCKNFIFSENIVERNNNLRFYGKRRWESAGIKVHCPTNSIIANNIIRNNYCHGIWSDQGAGVNSTFKNNIIIGNQQSGMNFEIGSTTSGKVLNNIFDANEYGVSLVTSGGLLIAHNLFLSSITADIYTNIFNRTADKWDSLNLEIYYNMFTSSPQYLQLTVSTDAIASRFMNFNQYNCDQSQEKFQLISIDGKTKINMTLENWRNKWRDFNTNLNYDENSVCKGATKNVLEELQPNKYNIQFGLTPVVFTSIPRPDITNDFFMTNWTEECIAGPFVQISTDTCLFLK